MPTESTPSGPIRPASAGSDLAVSDLSGLDDHRAAAALADLAGAALLRIRSSLAAEGITGRAAKDAGDAESQAVLAAALAAAFPGDAVLSEEAADDARRHTASRVWIIDPLDGTREFSEVDRDDWAVHVALWEDGALSAGAVALPDRGQTYVTDSPPHALDPIGDRPLRLAVSRSRPPEFVTALADRLGAELVPMGSAGVKAMSVLTGETDAYLHGGGQYEWDSAAPVAVAASAGLFTSRLDGSTLSYNNANPWLPDLIVCHPELSARLLSEISTESP